MQLHTMNQIHYDALYCGINVVPESMRKNESQKQGGGVVSEATTPATVPSWNPSLSSVYAYLEMQLHPVSSVCCSLSPSSLWVGGEGRVQYGRKTAMRAASAWVGGKAQRFEIQRFMENKGGWAETCRSPCVLPEVPQILRPVGAPTLYSVLGTCPAK